MREKLTRSGHDIREYRFTVSEDAFAELEQGRHVEIALPEAAGRSLIAHQTSYLWLQEHGRSRVLHLVPRRAQIAPLVGLSRWMAPEILTLGLSSARMSSPLAFRSIANAHRVYVSTPGLLINAIRRARFPRERMRQIGIVVLHGYDGLLSVDDDGHALLLRPMGIAMMSPGRHESLSQHGAAEYFWAILMRPLQQPR